MSDQSFLYQMHLSILSLVEICLILLNVFCFVGLRKGYKALVCKEVKRLWIRFIQYMKIRKFESV